MEPGRAEMELDLLSQPDRAPTEEIVEERVLDLSLSLAPTNQTLQGVDLNLSLSTPHYSQIGRDMAMNWGSSLSPAAIGQIASDMGWGLSLSLGSTEQADPVLQPRVGSGNRRQGGPCAKCGSTTTTQWRRGPQGARTLCNPCGIRFSRKKCAGCGITHAPQWRRGPQGARRLCNACGLGFSRQNGNCNRAN